MSMHQVGSKQSCIDHAHTRHIYQVWSKIGWTICSFLDRADCLADNWISPTSLPATTSAIILCDVWCFDAKGSWELLDTIPNDRFDMHQDFKALRYQLWFGYKIFMNSRPRPMGARSGEGRVHRRQGELWWGPRLGVEGTWGGLELDLDSWAWGRG